MANIFVAVIDAGVTNGTDVKVVDVAAEADVVVVDAADVLVDVGVRTSKLLWLLWLILLELMFLLFMMVLHLLLLIPKQMKLMLLLLLLLLLNLNV